MKNVKVQEGSPKSEILMAIESRDKQRFYKLVDYTLSMFVLNIARQLGVLTDDYWCTQYETYEELLEALYNADLTDINIIFED